MAKSIPKKRFYNFLYFINICFGIFLPGSSMNGRIKIFFFFSFSAYLISFWLKIMLGRDFSTFLLFFLKFSCPGRVWKELGTKIFFSSFSAYLIQLLQKIIPKGRFLFFCYFFQNFLARVEYERNSGPKFFTPFHGLSNPV